MVLVGKPDGRRLIGGPARRREDNIKNIYSRSGMGTGMG
jgi:hypothetical protein